MFSDTIWENFCFCRGLCPTIIYSNDWCSWVYFCFLGLCFGLLDFLVVSFILCQFIIFTELLHSIQWFERQTFKKFLCHLSLGFPKPAWTSFFYYDPSKSIQKYDTLFCWREKSLWFFYLPSISIFLWIQSWNSNPNNYF